MPEPILREHERTEVGKILSAIQGEVSVELATRASGCEACPDTEQLVREVASINDKIKLTVREAADGMVPSLTFRSEKTKGTLRYLGLPAGYEFRTLLDVLISAANGDSGLSPESKDKIARVSQPVVLQVYVTPG